MINNVQSWFDGSKIPHLFNGLEHKTKEIKKYVKILLDRSLFKIFKNRIDESVITKMFNNMIEICIATSKSGMILKLIKSMKFEIKLLIVINKGLPW